MADSQPPVVRWPRFSWAVQCSSLRLPGSVDLRHSCALYDSERVWGRAEAASGAEPRVAHVSEKMRNKKNLKRSREEEEQQELQQQEEHEEEQEDSGGGSSGEEQQQDGDDERRRQKLLEAIRSLSGRRRPLGERCEAAALMSEFSVDRDGGPGEPARVRLAELVGGSERTAPLPARTRKQLKKLQRSAATVQRPLSRQQTERIQRDLAFQKAASQVSRWDGVIRQNRRAETLRFPLDREPAGPRPVERLVGGWKPGTPLERQIFSLLAANQQPLTDPVLTPAEEASAAAMSLEEARVRRAELQKARALQSYYEAKARRERRIKSKKFHKVQNRAKRREFLKSFEQMLQTEPEAALQELRRVERARMQERMSLKHQNSSRWARSRALMAKYDQEARRAMQEQLEVNKELTQKLSPPLAQEEEEQEEEEELLPDCVNDAEEGGDRANPWMRQEATRSHSLTKEEEEEEEEEEEQQEEEEALLQQFDSRRKRHQAQASAAADDDDDEGSPSEPPCSEEVRERSAPLEETPLRVRTMEDLERLRQQPSEELRPPPTTEAPPSGQKHASKKKKNGVELKEVLTKETKLIRVPFAPTITDSEGPEAEPDHRSLIQEAELHQRSLIQEAFAGDDVVSDFVRDKRKQEDEGKPKMVALSLPGWGEWGGVGLKPSKRKRRRLRAESAPPPPPPAPRRDRLLPSVIISERRSVSVALHQVHSLPFPFQNQAQFEGCVRSPLGRAWNTERTVKKATRPRVLTRPGAVIPPMGEEELLRSQRS